MTTVPGIERKTVQLICDGCGHNQSVPDLLHDADVVWPLLTANGWNGSPFSTGPHWCPSCDGPEAHLAQATAAQAPQRRSHHYHADVRLHRDVTVVTIGGGRPNEDNVQEVLTGSVAAGRHIVVNLTGVEAIDSAHLGMLVRAYGDARLRGHVLCLVAPSKAVRIVLHTMRLDRAISAFDDLLTALAWLDTQESAAYVGRHER